MKNNDRNYAVRMFKNLANANRIKILEAIAAEKKPDVGQIAKITGLSQPTTSNNLAKMRGDNLISAKQDGLKMYYSIKDPAIEKILKLVKA